MRVSDPVAAVETCLDRIARLDGEIHAWAYVDGEGARAEARRLAGLPPVEREALPLFGVPFGAKDIFDTADMPTCWGSKIYRDRRPSADAALVARLRKLGAILIGKTHTTAFAYFDAGPTRNPRNVEHTPGGSSSGSAAAVSAGMVPLALGSQTMGSVLRPASFCGVVGFKPTFDKLPLDGVLPFAPSLDHAGLFTVHMRNLVRVWRALEPSSADSDPVRRLWAPEWPGKGELHPAMRDAVDACLERLEAAGFEVFRAPAPAWLGPLHEAIAVVLAAEAFAVHRERLEEHGDAVGAKLAELVRKGSRITDEHVDGAQTVIAEARVALASDLPPGTLAVTPAALGPAPRGLDSTGDPAANAPWTALGVPAVSLPLRQETPGLPLGLQLSGLQGQDDAVLATAAAIERKTA